jgi:hypothetical protein
MKPSIGTIIGTVLSAGLNITRDVMLIIVLWRYL